MTNLQTEITLLKTAYFDQLTHFQGIDLYFSPQDSTFRPENWLMVFPYNFLSIENNIEEIRHLALCNAFYVTFFMKEDQILDEYHLPADKFRKLVIDHCSAQPLRNWAVQSLVEKYGVELLPYLNRYESLYYQALIREKKLISLHIEELSTEENLTFLGHKLMPLCISFTAFCLKRNLFEAISLCEEMIIRYHIGFQLADDIRDLEKDFHKPDQSFLIKVCQNSVVIKSVPEIKAFLATHQSSQNIANFVIDILERAESIADVLQFRFFQDHLLNLIRNFRNTKN